MRARTTRSVLQAWLFIFAILFGAVAPGVNHALAQAGTISQDICTTGGVTPAGGAQPDAAPDASIHCSYCLAHCLAAGPLPASPALALAGATRAIPPTRYQAPHLLFPWTAARPRAPPATA